MIKKAVVTEYTPSVESGRRGTVEVHGESYCADEVMADAKITSKKLSKHAAFLKETNKKED